MSIAEQLQQVAQLAASITEDKAAIKTAIQRKGVPVGDIPLSEYPDRIEAIASEEEYFVHYRDYDGTLLMRVPTHAFTAPPTPPDHTPDNLTFDGWNVNLTPQTINPTRDYNVGAQYKTADGKTYIYIEISPSDPNKDFAVKASVTVRDRTLTIDWGDGTQDYVSATSPVVSSHSYDRYGRYVVTMWISQGEAMYDLVGTNASNGAFTPADKVTGIKLGQNIRYLNSFACAACYAMAWITLPCGISLYGEHNFSNCFSLKYVSIPDGTLFPGDFMSCYALQTISLPESVTRMGTFRLCYSLQTLVIPESATNLAQTSFQSCFSLTSVVLPDETISLINSVFQSCSALRSVHLPRALTSLRENLFYGCYTLREMILPQGVKVLAENTCAMNYGLTSVVLPEGLETIKSAFASCYALPQIIVPSTVTTMAGGKTLENCYNLKKIILKPEVPPVLESPLSIWSVRCKIYVPDSSLEAYRTATNWAMLANYFYPISQLDNI